MKRPGGDGGHVHHHTHVQNAPADDNAYKLEGQYERGDALYEGSAAGQYLPQADQAVLADVTTAPSVDSFQTRKPRPEDHPVHHTGHHIQKGGIDCGCVHHRVDLPAPT